MSNAKRFLRPLLALVFWLAVWQGFAVILAKPLLLPSPIEVLTRLFELAVTKDFWYYTFVSLWRIILGVGIAIILGLLLAVLCCRSSLVDTLVAPLLITIKSTPVASFVILVLIWVKRDYVPVLIAGLMVLPIIWANVCAGIRSTDKQLLEMAKVYKLSRSRVLKRIYIPSVMPHFHSACRTALGFGWKSGVAAEVLTVPTHSIGRLIYESKLYLLTTDLFAWTMVVVLLSLLLEKVFLKFLDRRVRNAKAG